MNYNDPNNTKCHTNKKALFELLIKNINFNEINSICLFSLGSPYYARRIEKEHPNIKITIVEDEEMEFLFCDIDNVIYANINNKEFWPKTMENINFDCIIMNPPYSRSLHLEILEEAISHAKKVVNLSPIRWLQDPLARYKKTSDYNKFMKTISENITSLNIVSAEEAHKLFGAWFYTNLGIYIFDRDSNDHIDYNNVWKRNLTDVDIRLINFIHDNMDNLGNHIDKNKISGIRVLIAEMAGNRGALPIYKDLAYVIDGKKEGKHWSKCKNNGGYEKDDSAPLPYSILFNSEKEANNFYKSWKTKFGNYLANLTLTDQHIPLKWLPWMGDVINPITGKKGYESEWTDEAFYKFFNITEEEQKIIEETMEKYK